MLAIVTMDLLYVYIYSANIKLRKNFIKNFRMEISILKDRNFCENRETVQIHIYIISILSLVKVVDRQLYQRIAS